MVALIGIYIFREETEKRRYFVKLKFIGKKEILFIKVPIMEFTVERNKDHSVKIKKYSQQLPMAAGASWSYTMFGKLPSPLFPMSYIVARTRALGNLEMYALLHLGTHTR